MNKAAIYYGVSPNCYAKITKLLPELYRNSDAIFHFVCLISLTAICGNLCTHLHEQIQWEQHLLMALLYIPSCLITNNVKCKKIKNKNLLLLFR